MEPKDCRCANFYVQNPADDFHVLLERSLPSVESVLGLAVSMFKLFSIGLDQLCSSANTLHFMNVQKQMCIVVPDMATFPDFIMTLCVKGAQHLASNEMVPLPPLTHGSCIHIRMLKVAPTTPLQTHSTRQS